MFIVVFVDDIPTLVVVILKFPPVALEILDNTVVRYNVANNNNNNQQLQNEEAGCLLFIESAGDKLAEVEQRFDSCSGKLSDKCITIESS